MEFGHLRKYSRTVGLTKVSHQDAPGDPCHWDVPPSCGAVYRPHRHQGLCVVLTVVGKNHFVINFFFSPEHP